MRNRFRKEQRELFLFPGRAVPQDDDTYGEQWRGCVTMEGSEGGVIAENKRGSVRPGRKRDRLSSRADDVTVWG